MRFKNKHFCGRIDNFMTSIVIFKPEILKLNKLNRNNHYLATEIEKEQKNMYLFDKVTFFEQAIFRIFRAP